MEIDNSYKSAGKPMRRFYLNRMKDETGVSRTGRVLEGVLTPAGKVLIEWRYPYPTVGVYNSLEEFRIIHMDSHPNCSELIWVDEENI